MASNQSNEKVQVVLRAATSVFLSNGFSSATTDMIQREAGVSKATLYACFPTKEALFSAVIADCCQRMADAFLALAPEPGDIEDTLTRIGQSYLDLLLSAEGLALFRVVVAEAPRFPELGRQFYLAGPKVIADMIAAKLELADAQGAIQLHGLGAAGAAGLFISLLRGESQLECLTHPQSRPSEAQRDHWVSLAVRIFLAAVCSTRGALNPLSRRST